MEYKDSQVAFQQAIDCGHFSTVANDHNYIGGYMYIGSDDNKDYFKHSETRAYNNRLYNDNNRLITMHNRLLQVAIDTGSDSIALEQNINAIRLDLGLEEITLYDGLVSKHINLMAKNN